mgnify:CR=1 FL=1
MEELAEKADVIFTATPQGLCASLVNEDILSNVKRRMAVACHPGSFDIFIDLTIKVLHFCRAPRTGSTGLRVNNNCNYVDVNFVVDPRTGRVIMMGAADNLVKGAAGQAVQNMNLLFGLPETEGLQMVPLFP